MPEAKRMMKINKGLVILIMIGMFVQLGVIVVGVAIIRGQNNTLVAQSKAQNQALVTQNHEQNAALLKQSRDQNDGLRAYQLAACKRGKLDRRDNADFQKAQTAYILKVTQAASVREDVKQAARKAARTFKRTSARLEKRAQINCTKAVTAGENNK